MAHAISGAKTPHQERALGVSRGFFRSEDAPDPREEPSAPLTRPFERRNETRMAGLPV